MAVATPTKMVEAFAINAPSGNITSPFPIPSQIATNPGQASLNDGFPTACLTPISSGGIPPKGADMNGILNLISSNVAASSAGQVFNVYDATYAGEIGGYAIGAILQQASNPLATWTNTVANNETDPDTGGAGWVSSVPLFSSAALAGPNDVVLPGPSDYVISVATGSGAVSFSGFVPQRDGQRITLLANGADNIKLLALQGSAAGHQIQASGETDVVSNDTITLQYSTGLGKWYFP